MFAYNYMFLKGCLRQQKNVIRTFMITNKICCKRIIFDDAKIRRCNYVLSTAINISNDDPSISVVDFINKGFAYLVANGDLFALSALECFLSARELDKDNKYDIEIECGISQTELILKNASNPEELCRHYIEPK